MPKRNPDSALHDLSSLTPSAYNRKCVFAKKRASRGFSVARSGQDCWTQSRWYSLLGLSRVGVFVFLSCLWSCAPRAASTPHATDPAVARQAVETALKSWQQSPDLPASSRPAPSIIFVDQQRRPGQRLVAYEVLASSLTPSGRRFVARLTLDNSSESVLAAYYVFGVDPVWVYRSEDFDMIMHWEHPMPEDSSAPTGGP
jgi:hypothetical protein